MKRSLSHLKNRTARFFAGFLALVAIVVCSVKIVTAAQLSAITVSGTTGDITVTSNVISGLTITPTLVFNSTNSSITYKTTLSNPDEKEFQIKTITDDNSNQYIVTSYDYDEEMNVKDKDIFITLTYDEYLPFGDDLNLEDIHITIDIEEKSDDQEPSEDDGTPVDPSDSGAPNTGANSFKFISSSTSNNTAILPFVIICIVAVAVIITVAPLPRKSRVRFNKIASIALVLAISGITINSFAASSQTVITIKGSSVAAMPDVSNPQEVVSAVFPNIYNNKVVDRPVGTSAGNAIILKTLDDKYVLMDTGLQNADIRASIYNTLRRLQGGDNIVIDYLVISHLDADHYGNAVTFMNDEHFTFRNIIYKHEVYRSGATESVFQSISQAAVNNNVHIITSGDADTAAYLDSIGATNYDAVSEGMVIPIGKYLQLDFYNTENVYAGKACPTGLKINWSSNINLGNLFKTEDGKYVYFDGSEYATKTGDPFDLSSSKYPYSDVTLKTTSTLITKENGSGMNRYFYATTDNERHALCTSNPNSFGILAEITTTGSKKYMYFTGDLENAGYSRLSGGANSSQIFRDLIFEDGEFKTNITPYAIPAEDDTAAAIYDKLASDATSKGSSVEEYLENIVLYQESHHGINDSEKAVWKLNLNRSSGIYAIAEAQTERETAQSFVYAKNYYYTLGNIPAENKIRVGDGATDGVDCTVNMIGEATCSRYNN